MDLAVRKAELDQQAADFAEREKVLKTKETSARHAEHVSFAEGLIRGGKLIPSLKDQAVAMLDFAAELETDGVVEFGEGDGKKSLPLVDSFRQFLSEQPKIVDFGEHAPASDEEASLVNFASPPGSTVDAAGLELHSKALAYIQKNPGTEYMTAVKACS